MHHKKSNLNGTLKNSEKEKIKNYGNDWINLFCFKNKIFFTELYPDRFAYLYVFKVKLKWGWFNYLVSIKFKLAKCLNSE